MCVVREWDSRRVGCAPRAGLRPRGIRGGGILSARGMCVDCAGFRPRGIRVGGIFPARGMCVVRGICLARGIRGGWDSLGACDVRHAWDSGRVGFPGILRRVGCARRVGFRALSFLTFDAWDVRDARGMCVVRGMPERAGFSTRVGCSPRAWDSGRVGFRRGGILSARGICVTRVGFAGAFVLLFLFFVFVLFLFSNTRKKLLSPKRKKKQSPPQAKKKKRGVRGVPPRHRRSRHKSPSRQPHIQHKLKNTSGLTRQCRLPYLLTYRVAVGFLSRAAALQYNSPTCEVRVCGLRRDVWLQLVTAVGQLQYSASRPAAVGPCQP